MVKFTIQGRIPSKKNSRKARSAVNKKTGKKYTFMVPSDDYEKWNDDASLQTIGVPKNLNPSRISLKFYFPCNRSADLTNKAESIMDMLVDNHILKDDSWQHTGAVFLIPCGIDRKDPRCEIKIAIKETM